MANGEIRYLQIRATDVDASSRFYVSVFDWAIRIRGDGHVAFDDASGHVSGTWILGRPPSREPGLLTYIQVGSVQATRARSARAGGEVVSPMAYQGAGEAIATFRDPGGNVLGMFPPGWGLNGGPRRASGPQPGRTGQIGSGSSVPGSSSARRETGAA
jgi:hypothetical protein